MLSSNIAQYILTRPARIVALVIGCVILFATFGASQLLSRPVDGAGETAELAMISDDWLQEVQENIIQSQYDVILAQELETAVPGAKINAIKRAYNLQPTFPALSTPPGWSFESDKANAEFGFPAQSAGDINNDGFDDVIIGARFYSNGQNSEGRAYVFYGSASGLSTTPDWIAESNQSGALFGRAVGSAGDLNDDGYDDIVVGASTAGNGGWVFVYYGGPGGLSCGGGCPVDATAAADWTAVGGPAGSRFGRWVNTAGDVNNDGFADIIVGDWLHSNGQSDEGRAYAFYGSASGLSCGGGCPVNATTAADWIVEGNLNDTALGSSVAPAGDVNGDDYDDVIVGAYNFNNGQGGEGMAFVYYGSATGLPCGSGCPADALSTADWSVESNQMNAALGQVASAGDINGDGYDDILLTASNYSNGQNQEGMAFVFHGSSTGLSCGGGCPVDALTAANWSAESNQTGGYIGGSGGVGSAGDVNGDGLDDIILGMREYDNPEIDEGAAVIFFGSTAGISCGSGCPVDAWSAADWKAEIDVSGAFFGISVAGVGDINGDCKMDVMVGASKYSNGQQSEGAAFVYYGENTYCKIFVPALLN